MIQFNLEQFFRALRSAPEPARIIARAEYSEYLQKEVFDKLKQGETVDLKALDWDAIQLCHVTPEWYEQRYRAAERDWAKGLCSLLWDAPNNTCGQRVFF